LEEKRYALKVFYLGTNYYGFQRQPDVPTIEGELMKAFEEESLINDNFKYTAASRTDRGAHAIGQTIAFTVTKMIDLDRLNDKLPSDIILWAYSEVPLKFNARREAIYRHYKYVIRDPGINIHKAREALEKIIGVHNFKNLCYKADKTTIRRIFIANVNRTEDGFLLFDFYGASFARGLIRKTVSAVIDVGLDEMSLEEFEKLLDPKYVPPKGIMPAPAENLFLVDAFYQLPFEINYQAVKNIREILEENIHKNALFRFILSEFEKNYLRLLEIKGTLNYNKL